MSVGRFCVRVVDLATREESIQVAAHRMHARKVGTLVVVNQQKQPIGIITDRDMTVKVLAQGKDGTQTTVGDVMTPCPKTVREQTSLEDALVCMRATPCRRLPVTDATGTLIGVLSLDDILELLAEEFVTIGRLIRAEEPGSLDASGSSGREVAS